MRERLNIAFFGSSLVSAYWNGAATYYRGIISALHRLGHTITFYEPDVYERQQHRDVDNIDYARSIVYSAQNHDELALALHEAHAADLVIKCSGVGVFDSYLEDAVLELQAPGRLVCFWDVDAPATLDRMNQNPGDPFIELVPRYDAIFTYGGGEPVVRAYKARGARRCVTIYNALDPSTHFQVSPDPRFECDLVFIGNRLPDREARVEEFFFKPARLLPDCTFLLGGNGWDQFAPELPNVKRLGHVYTRDHNAINSTAKAVLNISRESMARYGFSPATRVFEAAGAGSCIITDAWEGIESFLQPGKECLVARNGEEVAEILGRLTPRRASLIGNAARERMLSAHTYDHRAALVDTLLESMRSPQQELAS